MNKYHDKKGKFSKKQRISFYTISILLIAGILALAVVGADEVYARASQRVKDIFKPRVIEVVADTPEPTDMKDWVLWKFKQAGIDPYEAYAIINCESRWDPEAVNGSHNNGGNGTDLGLLQINTKYQPQVKPSCSLDYRCAVEASIEIYKKNHNSWKAWSCSRIVGLDK